MNDQDLAALLEQAKTIAVVGLSDKSSRASYGVARYLQSVGYRILPVNPTIERSLGEAAYGRLEDLPAQPDIIDVFRRPEHVPALAEPALASGARLFWMQQGIRSETAATRLRQGGMTVVEDRCLMIEHLRLLGG